MKTQFKQVHIENPDYEWFSTKSVMPQTGKTVLIFSGGWAHCSMWWTEKEDKSMGDHWYQFADKEVTHWLPLPPFPHPLKD